MFVKSDPERLLKDIVKLDAVEFLGICTVLGVEIYEKDGVEKDRLDEKDGSKNMELKPRNFTDIWSDLCEKVWGLSGRRRKNLAKLVKTATKKEK